MLNGYLKLGNEQIDVRFAKGEREFAEMTFATLAKGLPRLLSYFEISGAFPKVTAVLVPDRDEFDRLVRDLLLVEIEIPSHPARIAQPQRTDLVILSPSAYAEHSTFMYVPDEFRRLLVHELVHMVEEFLSPDIEASPRWWSEGLAVHFSEQARYEDGFRRTALDGIAAGVIPALVEVTADARLAYDWGWTIIAFIEAEYGKEMILRIVKECSGGEVLAFIDDQIDMMEQRWRAWLLSQGHLA